MIKFIRQHPYRCKIALLVWSVLSLGACGVAPAPISNPQYAVPAPEQNQVTMIARRASNVGSVTPIFIAITNGDTVPRQVNARQVFAVMNGSRVAAIPPGEAARLAGGAEELAGVLESAAASGVGGGAIGAGVGALAGALGGGVKQGAILGGAVGAGWGMFEGASRGASAARREANQQLRSLALRTTRLNRGFSASGYVFFPSGRYDHIEVLLTNVETGETETYRVAWP